MTKKEAEAFIMNEVEKIKGKNVSVVQAQAVGMVVAFKAIGILTSEDGSRILYDVLDRIL